MNPFRLVGSFGKNLQREIAQFEQNVKERFKRDDDAFVLWQNIRSADIFGTVPPSANQIVSAFSYANARGPVFAQMVCSVQAHITATAGNQAYCAIDFRLDGQAPSILGGATTALYSVLGGVYDTTLTFSIPAVIPDAQLHLYQIYAVTNAFTTALLGRPQFTQNGNFSLWGNL